MTSGDRRKPSAFVLEDEKPSNISVKRKPRAITGITFPPEDSQGELIVLPPAIPASSRKWRWGGLLAGSLLGLVSLWAGLTVSQMIEQFFARSAVLGWIALGVAGLAALSALAIIVREIWAFARLNTIEHIQTDATLAINHNDRKAGERAMDQLKAIYAHRHDAQWGLKSLKQHEADVMDPRDRMLLADRFLMQPRDEEAHRIIARNARRVTLLTTVTPAAALDLLFVAAVNLRMMRELASLYGGRPTTLSTLRLARMVMGHLAVTGGIALSDNLLQHVIGKGMLGRLSARLGEGAVNGIMTARIGLAARDVCRPVPQKTSTKETLGGIVRELVNFAEEAEKEEPKTTA